MRFQTFNNANEVKAWLSMNAYAIKEGSLRMNVGRFAITVSYMEKR